MTYQPLHHKYRPQTFADLVGQAAIATTLTNALKQQRIAPAYLFTGARGTGKTSSARILAKSLNCLSAADPTDAPCGQCEVCRAIAGGSALDVIEIDAASNTGVDNIRELIERAQFAPVQCRYKVYVIDECLTGDASILTDEGLVRLDNPTLQGKQVLSYNESLNVWEFKPVLRWLDQGERQTYVIETNRCKIKCTGNHLIRTETGWVAAKDLETGARILSPANVAAVLPSFESAPMEEPGALFAGINLRGKLHLRRMPHPQWHTSLETVKSVRLAGVERVYDIEVADNHNFVANGLLVHNCHMLSSAAFNALLKTLEEPPDRVVFVLATTDPQRVLPTIISRCQRFDFRRIPLDAMVDHLRTIADKEAIAIADDAVTLVAQISQGGLRDAESLLDQLSLLAGEVTVERVWDLVGAVPERDLLSLLQAIATDDPETLLDSARRLMDRGREPLIVLQNLASFYRDLLIAKTAPDRGDLVAITPPTWAAMVEFAQSFEVGAILAGQQHLRSCEHQLKTTTQPRLWLEISLMGLMPSALASVESRAATGAVSPKTASPAPRPAAKGQSPSAQPAPPIAVPHQPPIAPVPPTPTVSTPEEAAPPESPEVEAVPSTSVSQSAELDSIWQRIIDQITPYSTQVMVRQQCRLMEVAGQEVRIGVSSQPLFKMAQGKLPNIEAACKAVFGTSVRVSLEVAAVEPLPPRDAAASSRSPSPSPPTGNQRPAPRSSSPTVSESSARLYAPQPDDRSPGGTVPHPAPVPAAEASAQPFYLEEDEGVRAARQLADFFAGKVVNLEESSEAASSEAPVAAGGAEVASAEALQASPEATEEEDEEDINF